MATAADLQATLNKLGLGFLYSLLVGAVTDPSVDVTNVDVIGNLIETTPSVQQAYKERFKGNEERVRNGLRALKPSEYINAEQSYIERLRQNGMPIGFYDQPDDLAKLIGGDVSAVEFDNRITRGFLAAQAAPQSVRDQLKNLYGVDDTEIAAYFLDPTRATDIVGRKKSSELFSRQLQAAQVSAQAQQQANIQLGMTTAEQLAAEGVSPELARQGFTNIATQQDLYQGIGQEQTIGTEQQIAGEFGPAAARQAIAERRRRRTAAFEAGGSLATTSAGVSGLTTAGQ